MKWIRDRRNRVEGGWTCEWELLKGREAMSMGDVGVQGGDIDGDKQKGSGVGKSRGW